MNNLSKIALLTSSRADYSLYLPLIKEISNYNNIILDIISFGNHNSVIYGNSAKAIENDGFNVKYKIESLILGDSPEAISDSMGTTILKFSSIWKNEEYKLILCLGDRYEMFAAVCSSIPFNIPIAHISGGEVTLGAIDNIFRNSLTLMATYHFTSTEQYKQQVIKLIGENNKKNVYNVGALSFDNLSKIKLLSIEEFKKKYNIDLTKKSILITFHPETITFQRNQKHISELIKTLKALKNYQLIITMPNTDTMGNYIRKKLQEFISISYNAIGVESLGTIGYLSCMKHCTFMLGNTSSGFVEASYFPKFVINLGDRQKGRIETPNIFTVKIKKDSILEAVNKIEKNPIPEKSNIYGDGNTAVKITHIISNLLNPLITR